MGFKAITINTAAEAEAHILAEDDASLYSGVLGADCVLNIGSKIAASIISNNLVRVTDGVIVNGGHFGRIPYGEYEDIAVENGETGYNRNDLIVARFSTSGGIDTFEIDVVKGTATTGTAADPALTVGNLWEGAAMREMALYRVTIAGLSITALTPLFETVPVISGSTIIESGSNANGTYVKFGDGTMICNCLNTFSSVNITTAEIGTFRTSGTLSLTFPAAFYSTPAVSLPLAGNTSAVWGASGTTSNSAISFYLIAPSSKTISTMPISAIATGRWKA